MKKNWYQILFVICLLFIIGYFSSYIHRSGAIRLKQPLKDSITLYKKDNALKGLKIDSLENKIQGRKNN